MTWPVALACWWQGHAVERWHQPWRSDRRPGATRLVWEVCSRCERTLRQWVEAR